MNHKEDEVKCKECNQWFKGKKIYNHMRSHQSKPFRFCWKLFPKNPLISHMEICSAKNDIEKFKCHICPLNVRGSRIWKPMFCQSILLVSQAYQIWLHISVLIFGPNLETNCLFGSRVQGHLSWRWHPGHLSQQSLQPVISTWLLYRPPAPSPTQQEELCPVWPTYDCNSNSSAPNPPEPQFYLVLHPHPQ